MGNNMKALSLFILFFTLFFSGIFHSYASVESQLVSDIKKAQTRLNKTQQNITQQSQKLQVKTDRIEQKVLKLRNQTVAVRRLKDEQTLSLTSLEKRSTAWQQQGTYQRNLLTRFSQQQKIPAKTLSNALSNATNTEGVLSNKNLNQLSQHFTVMRTALDPQWQSSAVITDTGLIKQQSTLAIGPVSWFLDTEQQRAGFLVKNNGSIKQGLALSSKQFQQLHLLSQHKPAQISFDPTLTRALKIAQAQESVIQHIEKGGIWALPILAFGLFAFLISLFKGLQLARLPLIMPALAERLSHIDLNATQQVAKLSDQVKGMQQELLNITLTSHTGQCRDDQLFSTLLKHKHQLDYWLGAVAITAAVSPLLGLLGTVSGMIETFKLMTLFGAGDASAVSGGISEALVTTELGLIVAIPALLMHALLSRKVKTYYGSLEACAVQLSQSSSQVLTEAA